jgi:hypothetical protein
VTSEHFIDKLESIVGARNVLSKVANTFRMAVSEFNKESTLVAQCTAFYFPGQFCFLCRS